jgi:predicted enzyme related to lactoylglutathione lyase
MTDPRDSSRGTVSLPDTRIRGRFLWHELMTNDTRSAAEFYTRVVGWTMQGWDQNPSYQMFLAAGVPMAGLMTLPEDAKLAGAPPGWLGYIGSPDAEETGRLAARRGGRVLKEAIHIPGVGRFVVVQDPQGAVFSAFTPEQDPVGDDKPGLGDFSWHELATSDGPAAFEFYRELFGWEKTDAMDMGPGMGVYQMFGAHGQTLGGIYKIPPGAPNPPAWLPYALVPSSDRVASVVPTLGGQVINGPMDVPGGDSIVQILDPQGGMFAVHSKGTAKGAGPAASSKSVAGERSGSREGRRGTSKSSANAKRARRAASAGSSARSRKVARKARGAAKKVARKTRRAVKKVARKRAGAKRTVLATASRRGRAVKAKVRRVKRQVRRGTARTRRA